MLAIGEAALDHACGLPEVDPSRVAAAGYCLGATIAMEMAIAGLPICAAAGFHPSFSGLSLAAIDALACPLQLFIGAEDYATPTTARAELESALQGKGKGWSMTIYGSVKHSFTNPDCRGMGDRVAFDAAADEHAFAAAADLFATGFST